MGYDPGAWAIMHLICLVTLIINIYVKYSAHLLIVLNIPVKFHWFPFSSRREMCRINFWRKKERRKKKNNKNNNKRRSKHNMSPKLRLGDIINFFKSPLFCFHGNCGKVCPTDSDFFWGLSRSTRCGCCSYQVSSISVGWVACYDHFCVFQSFNILSVSMATAAILKIPKVVCTSTHINFNFWNFSDPIVEVNAVVRHFRQPWVLIRKIWQ